MWNMTGSIPGSTLILFIITDQLVGSQFLNSMAHNTRKSTCVFNNKHFVHKEIIKIRKKLS